MRRITILIASFLIVISGFAQDKTGSIKKGNSYVNLSFSAADTINESEIYWIEITPPQDYTSMQDVYIDIDSVLGTMDVYISLYGKLTSSSSWTAVGDSVNWAGTLSDDTTFVISNTAPNRYRYYKVQFRSGATDMQALISDVQFKQWYSGGSVSGSSITDGTATLTGGALSGVTTITLENGLTIDNAVNNTLEINENSDELIYTFGSNTVTVSSGDVTDFDFSSIDVSVGGDLDVTGDLTPESITQAQTETADAYTWLQYNQWSTGADMPAGGTYGIYGKANVGHTVQNAIGGKGAIKFLTLAADESINYGSGFEATLELDDVTTHTLTVTDHVSALNLYFDGSNKVEGVGGGLYSKMNLSRAMWNSTENFSIETNGYQLETANGSFLDYGFNIYNDGTMLSGIWIHNNPAGGTIANDITLQSGETIDNATDGVTNFGNSNIRGATWNFCDATGVGGTAASAVALDYTPDLPALQAGLMIMFVAEGANTTTLTIAVDGGTAKNVYEQAPGAAPSALEGSEINTGSMVMAVYDGTQWVMVSPSGN